MLRMLGHSSSIKYGKKNTTTKNIMEERSLLEKWQGPAQQPLYVFSLLKGNSNFVQLLADHVSQACSPAPAGES